jgi:hypothetical protein
MHANRSGDAGSTGGYESAHNNAAAIGAIRRLPSKVRGMPIKKPRKGNQ